VTSLSPKGRQVRCLRCRTVWHATPSHADKLLAAAEAIAPAAPAQEGTFVADGRTTDEAAEFAEVEAPPIAPVDLEEGRPPIDIDADEFSRHGDELREDVETAAARRYGHHGLGRANLWPLSWPQTGILALAIIDLILVGWRSDVVRILPQTASFYAAFGLGVNLRGLAFDNITTNTEQHEGVPILVVEGSIVNDAQKVVDVPRLKFVVRNGQRQEIYSWTAVPSTRVLPPGEAVAFHTRLASPPPEARDVLVRFVNRRDMLAAH